MNVVPFPASPRDPQQLAADPGLSAFVTANAGSGKTKTLIDRVARLLLAGNAPETILCVTYTKAAAAEMQRRLFALLGGWSVCDDEKLRGELAKLEGRSADSYDSRRLSEARALFARALETPGGLKIQTIHAFCEKLLRRFPLEAGVSPGFQVMDDAAAAVIAGAARKAVANQALKGEGAVAEAYARFSVSLDYASFHAMFADFEARRGQLAAYFARCEDFEGVRADVWTACCGDAVERDPAELEHAAMAALPRRLWRECAEALAAGGKTDQKCAAELRKVADDPAATLAEALAVLFTEGGEGTPRTWVEKTGGLKAHEGLRMALLSEQDRLAVVRSEIRAAGVAWDTLYALVLAQAYLTAYEIEKSESGALDFADLIERTSRLLASRPAAAWVLYKLDGGIDHILVDEAQDTAPDQWRIVEALTGEFFAGDGAELRRARQERHMFVVGDEKQSIYSFQGARPELLTQQYEFHRDRAQGAGFRFEKVELLDSWRSTPQVLSFVDAAFSPPELASAIVPRLAGEAAAIRHQARRTDDGCVDLWPLEQEEKGAEREAWDAPLDAAGETSANRRLAEKIACEIRDLVERGDAVLDKDSRQPRPARYGDVLILVRRRKALFEEILRALKRRGVPVAGADRLALSEHIVFDDLVALARFVQFPDDDLTLAALLRSPFCDVSDESLYGLAKPRTGSLWAELLARAAERPDWTQALAFLLPAMEQARLKRPFEFYGWVLGAADGAGRSMRARLTTRLGAEAGDAIDEFLAQVLAAEARGIEDLERLAAAFAQLDIAVKREMEAERDEVRVMTAHGSKGLEAPIVFLPETTLSRTARGSPLMETQAGGFLWCTSKDRDCEASAEARSWRAQREDEEALRLLYVALTRARDRLVLCGRISANAKLENVGGWWAALEAAFAHAEVQPHVHPTACGETPILRFGPDPLQLGRGAAEATAQAPLPAWTQGLAPTESFGRYQSPSQLGEDARSPAASPLAEAGGLGRFRRGDLIHRLLQILPDLPAAEQAAAAARILERERDLDEAQRAEMTAAALGVLGDPAFAEVFGPGSRAEVAIAGSSPQLPQGLRISGRVDRLVVLPDRVLVADFKTNRPSPSRIEDADPAYLRQMAVYAAVLAEVFPGRRIEAALVWTDGPKLMAVPELLMARSLAELRRGG